MHLRYPQGLYVALTCESPGTYRVGGPGLCGPGADSSVGVRATRVGVGAGRHPGAEHRAALVEVQPAQRQARTRAGGYWIAHEPATTGGLPSISSLVSRTFHDQPGPFGSRFLESDGRKFESCRGHHSDELPLSLLTMRPGGGRRVADEQRVRLVRPYPFVVAMVSCARPGYQPGAHMSKLSKVAGLPTRAASRSPIDWV